MINNGKESTRVEIIYLLFVLFVQVGCSEQQHCWTSFGGGVVGHGSLEADEVVACSTTH